MDAGRGSNYAVAGTKAGRRQRMKNNARIASGKPAVVVRRKAGKSSVPTGPTPPKPRQTSPVAKTETPADPPQPSDPPQQPAAAPQPRPNGEAAPSKTAERKRRRNRELEILRMDWPQTFPRDFRQVRPWAIGIAKDVARLLPEQPR